MVVEEDDDLQESAENDEEFDPIRRGPAVAAMDKLNKDQKIALTNKNLEVSAVLFYLYFILVNLMLDSRYKIMDRIMGTNGQRGT